MFKLVVTCSGFAATEQDFIQNQETFDLSCATEIEDYEEYPRYYVAVAQRPQID